ncbi:MAG TPA: hypothetical protein VK003_07475 [Oceanobacillus sp.]|nr:hypothetical protein [Oceanobacillus sp.]
MVKRWGMIAVLVLTWLILYYTLAFFTSLIMAPWDTALTRPELDTWQRSLNDLFETGGGQIVALALMLASMGVVLPSLRRRPSLAIQYVMSNAIFWCLLLIVFYAAAMINNNVLYPYPSVPYDPNYQGFHRSVFPGISILALCIGWLLWLRRVGGLEVNLRLQTG